MRQELALERYEMQLQHPAAHYEDPRNRAAKLYRQDEPRGGGHLLRDVIADTLCDERRYRFQTGSIFGRRKESKCLQKKTTSGDVRF